MSAPSPSPRRGPQPNRCEACEAERKQGRGGVSGRAPTPASTGVEVGTHEDKRSVCRRPGTRWYLCSGSWSPTSLPPGTSEAGALRRARARVGSPRVRARRHHRATSRNGDAHIWIRNTIAALSTKRARTRYVLQRRRMGARGIREARDRQATARLKLGALRVSLFKSSAIHTHPRRRSPG
ncbi:hypothetical protein B0H14DRAFT_2836024 [Mycena olivaceomarginata]|nr:hypothetical protein B0H14DRAFT_2836024 [Mycena olivaceomarginata]